MPNYNKQKGNRREYEVRDIFLARGYDVVKAGGSLGVFDLVCVPKVSQVKTDHGIHVYTYDTIFIQVKSNRCSSAEATDIACHETVARKEIWIKKDYKPWMKAVIDDPIERESQGPCGPVGDSR